MVLLGFGPDTNMIPICLSCFYFSTLEFPLHKISANVVILVLYPLHLWALGNLNISVAGTAADFILG